MSSKENHINITRENYEEYFLLYIDNELSAAEKAAVETFAMLHPDLGEELELLQGTRLEADSLPFTAKDNLFADNIRMQSVDESLLLYLDNELEGDEKKRVKFEIEHNPSYKTQFLQLQSVKLDPRDKIVCDFKHELYRNQESKRPVYWLRIAAAVILLIGAGSLILRSNKDTIAPVANTENKTLPSKQQVIPSDITPQEQVLAAEVKTETKNTNTIVVKEDRPEPAVLPQDGPQDNGLAYAPSDVTPNTNSETASTGTQTVQRVRTITFEREKQFINNDPVTNTVTPSSNFIAANGPESTGTPDGDGKQGSVRGLLRKATRFIERRTGINPVNDDDKLLVGVVAISLK